MKAVATIKDNLMRKKLKLDILNVTHIYEYLVFCYRKG